MLGINKNGNNWKYAIGNFLIILLIQVIFDFNEMLPQGSFPTAFQAYESAVKAFIVALAFYGINRATHKKEDSPTITRRKE